MEASKNIALYTARFFKYVWPLFNIMREKVKRDQLKITCSKLTVETLEQGVKYVQS